MARNRTIKPKFFDDVKIGRISRDARLLYIGLWVFADDMGVVPGDSVWLKSRVFPYDQIQVQQFEKWMNELVINGFICLLSYKGERFIYLPTFTRHQVVNRPNYEDLNIPKDLLDKEKDRIHGAITEQSLNNHGTFNDASCTVLDREKEALDGFPLQPSSLISEKEIKENTPYGVLKKNEKEGRDDTGLTASENTPPPGSAPPPSPRIDYIAIMNDFNARFAGKLPGVSRITDSRRAAVRARIAEFGPDSVAAVFDAIAASPFLCGANDRNWRADFDWIFKPRNYVKILENNYKNLNNGQKGKRRFGDHDPADYVGKGVTDI